jgi:uncharacterized membrane protein YphA (DoxX/SURF4 family)
MANRSMNRTAKILISANRIMLGLIFIFASWDKVLEPAAFAGVIANYQILPEGLAAPAAIFLPWLELTCGICLVADRWTGGSAVIVTALIVIFTAAIGFNIYRGMDVACGCFTLDQSAPADMWLYLLRDVIFLAMGVGTLQYAHARKTVAMATRKEML